MICERGTTSGGIAIVVVATVVLHTVTDNPVLETGCYLGMLVGAALGAWIGAERAPPGRRLVPRLIAAGLSLNALGDVLWSVLDLAGAGTEISVADPAWFASYTVLCGALWVILRRSRSEGHVDVDFAIDAVTIVVVSLLIFWNLSIDTIVADDSASAFARTVWAAYPVADAVLLALVVRILMSPGARTAIGPSFALGICLWLAADIAYLHAPEGAAKLTDAAWMVAPVLLARAAWLVPHQRSDVPGAPVPQGWTGQMIVAVGPLMVPPALELVSDLRGKPDQPLQLFTGTAVLIALAFMRTARLIRSEADARRELEGARDAALAASRAKSMFLANISHEVRTPLTTVLATAEILEDTPLDDAQLKLVARLHRSGRLLKRLVEDILDFSRIEAGQLQLASTAFDLHAMVADAADAYEPQANQAGIRFDSHLEPGVPRTVVGDPGRLFQVLTNLLDNAVKFTHRGHITLTARPAPAGHECREVHGVELIVADTGIGIREEDHQSVFESFSQVDGSATRSYGGSGLGLAICRELAQLMGGSITLHSEYGVGTTVVVRLPVAQIDRERTATGPGSSRPG
ncbi:ATP-binding protein [Nocardioides sp. W7]|uniref:sensor histidine kinase n=1 Tax=Nocardioides sp. W7 TaxID=2931390 RepID=UPI001FCF9145|nr:ATP-binding protein [Nocardioides sp. W7]